MWGDCQAWRNEIEECGAGAALSGGALAHLSSCARCREARAEGEKLGRLLGGLGRVEAPPDFDFRLRARLARLDNRRPLTRTRPRFAAGLAFAACVVAVCALALLRGTGPGPEAPESMAGRQSTSVPSANDVAARPSEGAGGGAPVNRIVRGSSRDEGPRVVASVQARRTKAAQSPRASGRHRAVPANDSREREDAVFGSSAARVRTASGVREELASTHGRPLAIPVGGSDEPLRILLRDESGAARSVPTRSVSFGAQQIVARERGTQKASSNDQEGVW